MLVVVDGTGPEDDVKYKAGMKYSFCKQLEDHAGATYFRGPTDTGWEVSGIADRVVGEAVTFAGLGRPILLAGYSRGGATVINAAARLKTRGLRVQAMFLFDAVDMQASTFNVTQVISDNVDYVAHARGARALGFYLLNPNRSRWYFVNTGRWLAGNGERHEKKFTGTHGAIGGAGWSDIGGEVDCQLQIASWMNGHLRKFGITYELKSRIVT